uniref:NADH-ubiquinone oxidoreductase chain 4 n=1 Tax=Prionospio fallax TaxID=3050094 RepID=A0AAU6QGD7_9ANNE
MLTIFLPLVFLLLMAFFLPPQMIWSSTAVLLLLLSLVFLSQFPFMLSKLMSWSLFLDPLSSVLILLTLWLTSLMIFASQKVMGARVSPSHFTFTMLFLTFILILAFSSSSLMMFYIYFEASLIPTLFLIMVWGYQPERLQASMYLILYTVAASLPLLLSLTNIFKSSGHLSLALSSWNFFASSFLADIWWIILIAAFLVKTPMFLTHLWLPKAHVEAPVAGSMVLAGILLKLGSYGILRVASKFIFLNMKAASLILSISLIGGVLTGFICIRQTDVKALIAYSSVSHMGLATAGIMTNSAWGWQGAFMMLIAHGLCSSCMFSLANMTYETISSRSMFITKGLMNLFPSLCFWWFCFSACNMAAPPSMNLAAEILLISSSMAFSSLNSLPLFFMVFMAAAYSLLLYTSTQHGTNPNYHNSLSLFTQRNYTIALGHFLPLIGIILKSDLVLFWL